MAKLTARFDLEDRISKKLKTISGDAKNLEKARSKLDKPLVMKVKDEATKSLKKIHGFVRKDIAKTHTMMVTLRDQATRPLNKLNTFMKRKMPRTHDLIVKAQDKTRTVLEKIRRYAGRHLSKPYMLMVAARDRATPILHKIANYARRALSKGYNFSVRAIDIATKTVGRIASFARTAIPRYRDFTIRAWDRATRVVGTIRRALFSIPTLITVTLAVVGVGKLKDATVGAAMNFEGYGVSMEHWLDGNKKQAQELVTWMGQFADITPFSSPDLFPALARGVGLADGNVEQAKKLLEISANMAALTPGRTVEDAMEALGAAQMGEFQMLKGYNMKVTADDYADMGWEGLISEIDGKFAGGAQKLSETSAGILATLAGYRSSILRSMGEGFLEPMKPRLNAISDWLENNQETWGRWKDTVKQAGEDASEWIFSKLENGFSYIRKNYLENDEFKKLDFEGKVKFIMSDLKKWWDNTGSPLLQDVGMKFGKSMYEGMVWGVKEGIKAIGGMWGNAFEDPSVSNFASAGIATAIAASIASVILSPLTKGIGGIFKGGKWLFGQARKIAGLFGKGKAPKIPPIVPTGGKAPKTPTTPKNKPVIYDRHGRPLPPSGSSPKPTPTPKPTKTPKIPKMPKGLNKILNFGKKIPVIGTLLSGLALATAPKEDKAGVAGSIGGGIAGAATGAAIGSIIPVIGTTIGGLIGGILGSMGGHAIGDWFSDNWSSIKQGAKDAGDWVANAWDSTWSAVKDFGSGAADWISDAWSSVSGWFSNTVWTPIKDGAKTAGTWVSDKFNDGVGFIKDKWSKFSGWFGDKVWTPLSDAAINTMNFFVGLWDISREWISEKWSDLSDWFSESVWEPVKEGAAIAGQWISDKYTDAKEWVSETWASVSEWFDETVWQPVKEGAAIAGQWISDKYTAAKNWISETWSTFSGWFDETVWSPVKEGAAAAGQWISDKYGAAKDWVTEKWSVVSGWFSETVWEPVKEGAAIAGEWISEKYGAAKDWVTEKWGVVSGWFSDNVWTPIKDGAATAMDWVGEKFSDGVQWAKDAWDGISGWFDKNVWSPVKTGAQKAWGWIKGKWNDAKDWAGDITKRGEDITGVQPSTSKKSSQNAGTMRTPPTPKKYATGGFINRPHLGLVGEAGPEAIIPLSSSRRGRAMSLYEQTGQMLGVKPYASGGMVGTATLPQEQVKNVISFVKEGSGKGGSGRDIIVQITGDNHYENEMDAEKVGDIAVGAIIKKLKDEYDEGGELVVYE